MIEITKENAIHFLQAQIYLNEFTTDDINIKNFNQAVRFIIDDNKEKSDQLEKFSKLTDIALKENDSIIKDLRLKLEYLENLKEPEKSK